MVVERDAGGGEIGPGGDAEVESHRSRGRDGVAQGVEERVCGFALDGRASGVQLCRCGAGTE